MSCPEGKRERDYDESEEKQSEHLEPKFWKSEDTESEELDSEEAEKAPSPGRVVDPGFLHPVLRLWEKRQYAADRRKYGKPDGTKRKFR